VPQAKSALRALNRHFKNSKFVVVVCKYDSILNSHVLKSIQLSKHLKQQKVSDGAQLSKGRGSLLTFLSKSFVNKLVACLTLQIQCSISEEVKQAGTFSIEVDSTQDIAVMDQLASCVRYVHCGKVKVRLIKLVVAKKTTGEALYWLVKSELERLELSTSKIIGCSFDGAANMSGQYNGLQAKLKQDNEDIVHVHCQAHVLNLVMTDSIECCKQTKDFLGLLQNTAVLISESHKRMLVWTEVNKQVETGHNLLRRLQKIGATRWWSKDKALSSMFDDNTHSPLSDTRKFATLLICLHTISNSEDFNADVTFRANALLENWCKFKNILTAWIFCEMFRITSPTSSYLQTHDLNYQTDANLVNTMHSELIKMRAEFQKMHDNCKAFVKFTNESLSSDGFEILIEENLPSKRIHIPKRQADDLALDESRSALSSPAKEFEIMVFNVIFDTVQQQISNRFRFNEALLKDIAWLDPKNFNQLRNELQLPDEALKQLAHLSKTDWIKLIQELHQFSTHFEDYNPDLYAHPYTSIAASNIATSANEVQSDLQNAGKCYHKLGKL